MAAEKGTRTLISRHVYGNEHIFRRTDYCWR